MISFFYSFQSYRVGDRKFYWFVTVRARAMFHVLSDIDLITFLYDNFYWLRTDMLGMSFKYLVVIFYHKRRMRVDNCFA